MSKLSRSESPSAKWDAAFLPSGGTAEAGASVNGTAQRWAYRDSVIATCCAHHGLVHVKLTTGCIVDKTTTCMDSMRRT